MMEAGLRKAGEEAEKVTLIFTIKECCSKILQKF
jgi:hypothetical protein